MRLLTYRTADGSCRLGALLSGERVLDLNLAYAGLLQRRGDPKAVELAAALVPADTVDFLRGGERSLAEAAATIADAEGSLAGGELPRGPRGEQALFERQDVRLGPPVPRPPKIICLSHNYWCFIEETGVPVPPEPRIFSKYHNAICGPEDPIIYPRMTKELGYEAELAFVIGKPGRHIPEQKAFDHIAGYTIFNDVSASDLTKRDTQVLRGKTFDNFAPTGPFLVTRDEVPDPHNLNIKCWVNEALLQDSNTSKLVYNIPRLVSFLSQVFELEPGDMVATGCPAGLAKFRNPPTFMQVGDTCTIEIDGLGRLSNRIVPEP